MTITDDLWSAAEICITSTCLAVLFLALHQCSGLDLIAGAGFLFGSMQLYVVMCILNHISFKEIATQWYGFLLVFLYQTVQYNITLPGKLLDTLSHSVQ